MTFEGPWAARFEDSYRRAETDFVRNILIDGEISEAEFAEARSRMEQCMVEKGFPGWFEQGPLGGWVWSQDSPSSAATDANWECNQEWMGDIWGLYDDMAVNPNNEDMNALTVQCLVRNNLVPSGFTTRDWEEFQLSVFGGEDDCFTDPDDPNVHICATAPAEGTLPGGVDFNSEEVYRCMFTPLHDLTN